MRNERWLVAVSLALGSFAFAVVLACHRVIDGDLWARLAVGAHVWKMGTVMRQDVFAFTPTLPQWIDHEWGAGVVFFAMLNWFGPASLMILKIVAALGALAVCIAASRASGTTWAGVLFLAVPCALAVLPGYVPVVRSHVFTYGCFAATLWWLELMRRGRRWPAFAIVAVMLLWANVHGGFIVGLVAIAVYTAQLRTRAAWATLLAALAITCVNPYGLGYWTYLVPAWLHPRADIPEWGRMPVWGFDPYFGFRLLFVIVLGAVAWGWKRRTGTGLTMLALTAAAGWLHRRHAPFFGLAALVYVGPYFDGKRLRVEAVAAAYVVIAAVVAWRFLPQAALEPAGAGHFLSRAHGGHPRFGPRGRKSGCAVSVGQLRILAAGPADQGVHGWTLRRDLSRRDVRVELRRCFTRTARTGMKCCGDTAWISSLLNYGRRSCGPTIFCRAATKPCGWTERQHCSRVATSRRDCAPPPPIFPPQCPILSTRIWPIAGCQDPSKRATVTGATRQAVFRSCRCGVFAGWFHRRLRRCRRPSCSATFARGRRGN